MPLVQPGLLAWGDTVRVAQRCGARRCILPVGSAQIAMCEAHHIAPCISEPLPPPVDLVFQGPHTGDFTERAVI